MSTYAAHPIAEVFPMLDGETYDQLVADIRAQGLLQPIVLHDGRVLDGRNRQRACHAAGVPPRFEEFDGDDPVAFVVSLNLRRRHLDEGQRAAVAARLANLDVGANQHSGGSANLRRLPPQQPIASPKTRQICRVSTELEQPAKAADQDANLPLGKPTPTRPFVPAFPPPTSVGPFRVVTAVPQNSPSPKPVAPVSVAKAAQMLNVSPRSVDAAKAVIRKAVPGLIEALDKGKVSVAAALVASDQPPEVQRRFVDVPKAEQRQAVREWRDYQTRQAKPEPVRDQTEIQHVALAFKQISMANVTPDRLVAKAFPATLADLKEHGVKVRAFLEAIEGSSNHDQARAS